jgi:dehydrogenase/reductase SDR family protein 12
MVAIEERVEIPVPLAVAFAYYAEYAHIQEWDPGVASCVKQTPGPLRPGDRYDVVSLFFGRKLPMNYQVVSVDAPHRVVLRGTSETGVVLDDIRFTAKDAGTTVITWGLELKLSGLGRLGEPLLKPLLQRLGKEAMRGIRESAARGQPARAAAAAADAAAAQAAAVA